MESPKMALLASFPSSEVLNFTIPRATKFSLMQLSLQLLTRLTVGVSGPIILTDLMKTAGIVIARRATADRSRLFVRAPAAVGPSIM
jgi:hypothetical protein